MNLQELPMMGASAPTTIEGQVVARSTAEAGAAPATGQAIAFSFGDPEPVLDRRELAQHIECWRNGRYYEPPISMDGLVRSFDMAPHHASCIRLKVNLLSKYFIPSRWLDRPTFGKLALDFLTIGNGYLEQRDNLAGRPLKLDHILGRYARRGIEEGEYFFVPGWRQEHAFRPGKVFHMKEAHPSQEIYGLPEYLSALQSGLLNEAATLFRRKYYRNGSHAGYILYATGAGLANEDADKIRQALRDSKGPGNFRNLFLHAPGGKEGDVKLIPISEVAAKDEFLGIKNTTRDDMLAAHRVPPNLIAVVPANPGGFGDVSKAVQAFMEIEIEPLQSKFLELNDWLGLEAVGFRPYEPKPAAAAA
jgi:PBSX family phage portal protein